MNNVDTHRVKCIVKDRPLLMLRGEKRKGKDSPVQTQLKTV